MMTLTPEANRRANMILENIPRVKWIAAHIHQHLPQTVVLEDLVSIGVLGLIEAVDRYDPAASVQFKTFAEYRIRGAILDSVCELDGIPAHKRSKAKRVKLAVRMLEQRLGRTPSSEEIAAELGVSMEEYHEWVNDIRGVTFASLAVNYTTDNGEISLEDTIADKDSVQPEALVEQAERKELVEQGLNALPALESKVAKMYFQEGLCLRQIARTLDLHLTRVSQLKSRAIEMLRSFVAVRCHMQKRGACV
jgi:RNA polymerase sigma factor for flagellar operon FliA